MTDPYQPPPAPPWGPPPSSGAIAWGLGLLVFVPLPFLSSVMAGLVMVLVGRAQRRHGPVAAANGRAAAAWGLVYLVLSVIAAAAHFSLLYVLTKDGPSRDFFPLGIPLTIFGAITLAHIVICFLGLVRANRGAVFSPLPIRVP